MTHIDLIVTDAGKELRYSDLRLPVHLGRESRRSGKLGQTASVRGELWVPVAAADRRAVSRHVLTLVSLPDGIRVKNPHASARVYVGENNEPLLPQKSIVCRDDFRVTLPGGIDLSIRRRDDAPEGIGEAALVTHQGLVDPNEQMTRDDLNAMFGRGEDSSDARPANPNANPVSAMDVERSGSASDRSVSPVQSRAAWLWCNEVLKVVRKAAHSGEFYEAAMRSVADLIGLDHVCVILRDGDPDGGGVQADTSGSSGDGVHPTHGQSTTNRHSATRWRSAAAFDHRSGEITIYDHGANVTVGDGDDDSADSQFEHTPPPPPPPPASSIPLLHQVIRDRAAVTYDADFGLHRSMDGRVDASRAVAVPMTDDDANIIGVLYGDRCRRDDADNRPLEDFELVLMEVIGGAISAGLVRQQQERLRSSMSEFFSPQVVRHLQTDRRWMRGREADVSVMFCDIRGFSRVSERIGPEATFEWIGDVMTDLSRPVAATDGVVVDYIGDELMAMWGAPAAQPDHAVRACEAARQMAERIGDIRDRWIDRVGVPFDVGIGIGSGRTQVGNTGSSRRFKYGPLGPVVNLASRVQGLTKAFGVRILITEATRRGLSADAVFATRRLSQVRPVGMDQAIDLYEMGNGRSGFATLRDQYETALEHFEAGRFPQAARVLSTLVIDHPDDVATVSLLARVVHQMQTPETHFDPVFAATAK